MDLRGWEYLWKTFATIGIVNLFVFVIIVFVFAIDSRSHYRPIPCNRRFGC